MLILALTFLVPAATWCLGQSDEVRWHLEPNQSAAWLATLPENPALAPSASLKVAVAPDVTVTGVEILEPVWREEPWDGNAPAETPVARLGVRSSWHGVPFQEILISPIQRSSTPHQVRILESCSLRLLPVTESEAEAMTNIPPVTGDLASFANPLRAAELKASRAQVRQSPELGSPGGHDAQGADLRQPGRHLSDDLRLPDWPGHQPFGLDGGERPYDLPRCGNPHPHRGSHQRNLWFVQRHCLLRPEAPHHQPSLVERRGFHGHERVLALRGRHAGPADDGGARGAPLRSAHP